MDENFEYEDLLKIPDLIKLNLGKVTSINSMGVRKFLAFTLAWSPRRFEFHECTPEFIANVNVIPQMLGSSADEKQIVTFYVPFSCEHCQTSQSALFKREEVVVDEDGEVVVPDRRCQKCNNPLDLDVETNEYFMFLADAANN
jgi:hypothetical protein